MPAVWPLMSYTCLLSLDVFICKVEMLPHTSLSYVDSMTHQVILGPSKNNIWLSFQTWSYQLHIWKKSGTELLCACLIYIYSVHPLTSYLPQSTSQLGHYWYCEKLNLISRNSMCTVFRNAGHYSPVASTPAEGGQYHQVSSRGRDDMNFDLPVLDWGLKGGYGRQILDSVTPQENFQVIHTPLQSRPCRDFSMAGGRAARERVCCLLKTSAQP